MSRVQCCRVVTFVAVSCVLATGCNRATDNTGESSKQAAGLPSDAKSSGWISFVPDGGGFHAKFPAKPNYTYRGILHIDAHQYRANGSKGFKFYVGVSNYPLGTLSTTDPKTLLIWARDRDGFSIYSWKTRDISLGKAIGIEEYGGLLRRRVSTIVRRYYSNGRVYTVRVTQDQGPESIQVDDPLIVKFFDSFEIRPGLPTEPGPPSNEKIAKWLEMLRSGDAFDQYGAALRIAAREPTDPPNPQISKALVEVYLNGPEYYPSDFLKALWTWGTPANAPALAKTLKEGDRDQANLLHLLGHLKNPEVIPEILAFAEHEDIGVVRPLVVALSGYGPSIEPRMIKIVQSNDQSPYMKAIAIGVLRKVGTSAAIPALTNFRDKAVDGASAGAARSAIKRIQQREKQK